MTQAVFAPADRLTEMRAVAPICAAHFLSHYYMLLLAPLLAFIRADYGVSYTDIALALTVFNVVSAVMQTPAGFLVDRVSARRVLIVGVALGSAAVAAAGLVNSFAAFIAMFGVAGLANTVYHPADYSLLSHGAPSRISQIFSIHTFSGILGGAVAPATLLAMQAHFGWRGAFVGAAILGLVVLALLVAQRGTPFARPAERSGQAADAGANSAPASSAWRMLLAPPILLNLGFFILTSIMGGLGTFLIVALGALYGTSTTLANVALSGLLLLNALGVLVGGFLASWTKRHATVAALCLAGTGIVTALVGVIDFAPAALVSMMSLSGLFVGMAAPSRDMLVRAVTPPGAFGRVFGFVSSGYNIGAMIAPTIYGMMMDHGAPRSMFLFSAACSILCIGTVVFGLSGREQK